jgi:hypothetical protein
MVAYLVKTYNIPTILVVNSDQIGLHLVLIIGEWTWENKGAEHIKVSGIEDKRHVILVVSSYEDGLLIPIQVVFIGTTHKTLPPK